jgi:Peptidase S24-like
VEVDVTEPIEPATKAAVLRRGATARPITIEVTGPSMGTTIASGSQVRVTAGGRPRRGEIWAFVLDDGMVVVHRFRRERAGALWFQGDGNAGVDRPVVPDRLVGRVDAVDFGGRRTRFGPLARVRGRLALDATALRRRIPRMGDDNYLRH